MNINITRRNSDDISSRLNRIRSKDDISGRTPGMTRRWNIDSNMSPIHHSNKIQECQIQSSHLQPLITVQKLKSRG